MARSKLLLPSFVEPMLCLDVDELPEGPDWDYQVNWVATVPRRSAMARRQLCCPVTGNDLAPRFPAAATALAKALPNGSVVDGEPTYPTLRGAGSAKSYIYRRRDYCRECDFRVVIEPWRIGSESLTSECTRE